MHYSNNLPKKRTALILILSIFSAILLSVLLLCFLLSPKPITEPIEINGYTYNYLNNLQLSNYNGPMLTSVEGRLYACFPEKVNSAGRLYVYENGQLNEIAYIDMTISAFIGEYIYGYRGSDSVPSKVYAYNILTRKETELFTGIGPNYNHWYFMGSYFASDGSYYIPNEANWDENNQIHDYYKIKDGKVMLIENHRQTYRLGNRTYSVVCQKWESAVYCTEDNSAEAVALKLPGSNRFIIPVEQGLLIYISDSVSCEPQCLYLLTEEEKAPICLFIEDDEEDYYRSSINMYKHYVYISLNPKAADGWPRWDWKSGTYRIDLRDNSVKKLSSKIYCGLYVFDDTGIYACDRNANIYKLDFDGKVLGVIRPPE